MAFEVQHWQGVRGLRLLKKIDYDVQIDQCQRNAERFYADAKILYEAKSYGYAVALCILGMEEIGKKIAMKSVRAGLA